jgi:hypothetical protein
MTSTFGASCGAVASRNAGQSALDLRMSRSIVPLKREGIERTPVSIDRDEARAHLQEEDDAAEVGMACC